MASESALTATEMLWKPPAPMSSRSISCCRNSLLSGDAQYALSGVGGVTGLLRRTRTFSGDLFHGFDALGDGGGAHSQDICCRVEGAVFNDGWRRW